jgi:hypothetical protein
MSQPLVRELSPGEDDDVGLPLRRWIGEETRRGLPPYVYKYYLNRTRAFRRQSLKVRLFHQCQGNEVLVLCSRMVCISACCKNTRKP